jgi:hypothetical protein
MRRGSCAVPLSSSHFIVFGIGYVVTCEWKKIIWIWTIFLWHNIQSTFHENPAGYFISVEAEHSWVGSFMLKLLSLPCTDILCSSTSDSYIVCCCFHGLWSAKKMAGGKWYYIRSFKSLSFWTLCLINLKGISNNYILFGRDVKRNIVHISSIMHMCASRVQ